jgi:Phytanoyl-CoA dioxygenase (PhyH)
MSDIAPNETVLKAINEFRDEGFCVLRGHLPYRVVNTCRDGFWPSLLAYLQCGHAPNRGPNRHFLPMPFERPCFAAELFFDLDILRIVRGLMDDRIVADQWGCDVPVRGSEYQAPHVDYKRPLFPERPDFELPPYAIVVSFGLVPIAREHGPIEIAPCTHRMRRENALQAVEGGDIGMQAIPLDLGDVLIRHPRALHRGTPNTTDVPRAFCTIRYVRRWYADGSRDVNPIPLATRDSLTPEQQGLMRFPIGD